MISHSDALGLKLLLHVFQGCSVLDSVQDARQDVVLAVALLAGELQLGLVSLAVNHNLTRVIMVQSPWSGIQTSPTYFQLEAYTDI